MKPLFILFFSCLAPFLLAQHTFSIVAVDPATGEVGSAGASCIDINDCAACTVKIISGILPGRGGVNAQASICIPHVNLQIALTQMEDGLSPEEILTYLVINDGCNAGNYQNRQYGIVDFDPDGNPRSAAYTGSSALNYANHIEGATYAIQGNILLGQSVLDSMESRFLATEGPLAKKLMAALQGANVPGADTRCLNEGTSSKSAYIRVAQPTDAPDALFLDLQVPSTPFGMEPIDSLQTLFDAWMTTVSASEKGLGRLSFRVFPNPASDLLVVEKPEGLPEQRLLLRLLDARGTTLLEIPLAADRTEVSLSGIPAGKLLFLEVRTPQNERLFSQKVIH